MMRRTFTELLNRLYTLDNKKSEDQPAQQKESGKKSVPAAPPEAAPLIDSFRYSASFKKSVTISALLTYGLENQKNAVPAQNRLDKVA